MANILKKISTKTSVSVQDFKTLTTKTPVLRILGILRTVEEGQHAQYGRFLKFKGDFQATDLRTGEVSVSSVAFLPAPVDTMLEEAFRANEGASVEFGFDICVSPRPDTAIGYEYIVESVLEQRVSDPMAALVEKAQAKKLPLFDNQPKDNPPEANVEAAPKTVAHASKNGKK